MRKERRPAEAESMPEAEVTLRLAFWLLHRAEQKSHADIAIDGARQHGNQDRPRQQGRSAAPRLMGPSSMLTPKKVRAKT